MRAGLSYAPVGAVTRDAAGGIARHGARHGDPPTPSSLPPIVRRMAQPTHPVEVALELAFGASTQRRRVQDAG
jgi:hypothetical protein